MLSDANATKCKESLSTKKNLMRLVLIALILVSISISCKKSNETGSICFTRTQTELKIKNNSSQSYYFTAFGQSVLPLINWAPLCSNNGISAKSSLGKQLATIYGYSDSESIVVFWWECAGNTPGEVFSVVLDRNQTVCK